MPPSIKLQILKEIPFQSEVGVSVTGHLAHNRSCNVLPLPQIELVTTHPLSVYLHVFKLA